MFCDILQKEIKLLIKSDEANEYTDIRFKSLSDAAICRVEFWMKRIATVIRQKRIVAPSGRTEPSSRMIKALKRYICLNSEEAQDTYYLFKEMILHLVRNFMPKNKLSTVLTVDCVNESVKDRAGPLYEYLSILEAVRSLPMIDDEKACDRRSTSRK
jgi:flagellar biosynthesis regulator FlbT